VHVRPSKVSAAVVLMKCLFIVMLHHLVRTMRAPCDTALITDVVRCKFQRIRYTCITMSNTKGCSRCRMCITSIY